ncbi:MAG: hypothetical protein GX237_10400 [Clostridiales bacterium]|nr:hypothetical protein [Clostridiales bacterium]
MRKSAGKIFFIQFIKSVVFIFVFFGVILVTYLTIMNYYGIDDSGSIKTIAPVNEKPQLHKASVDDVSKHLIFSVDEESGEIKKLVLEIFNCRAHRIAYITIPIKTQFTLSDSLYRQLVLIKPSIPQSLKLSAITGYFPKESVYEYGVLMIEDLLDMRLSYYSVIPEGLYEDIFKTDDLPRGYNDPQNSNRYPGEMFSDDFLEFLSTIDTERDLGEYIEKIYNEIDSSLSIGDKLNYLESYIKVPGENISFEVLVGNESNSEYTVDKLMAYKQIGVYLDE